MKLYRNRKPRVAIFFKDFAHWTKASCVGLNVAGMTTAQCLQQHGIEATAWAVRHNVDIVDRIESSRLCHAEYTHAVISAPWLTPFDLAAIVDRYPSIKFAVLSHSGVAFLQADPGGLKLLRQYLELSRDRKNLEVGGNCMQFAWWFADVYRSGVLLLPNMYPIQPTVSKTWGEGRGLLRIGAFGAIRAEKNLATAAAAAMLVARWTGVRTELHMTTGGEAGDSPAISTIREMAHDVEGFSLVEHPWQQWDKFIRLVAEMDLLLQPSFTESFNMVTADGVAMGVPSVVSPAIRWAPREWKCDPDHPLMVAEKALELLRDSQGYRGSDALKRHNGEAIQFWRTFLCL